MEAKGTVKEWSQKFEEALVDALCRKYGWEHDEDRDNAYETIAILKPLIESNTRAQAEISFPIGMRKVIRFANQFAGIKHNPEWKAKLKEWEKNDKL